MAQIAIDGPSGAGKSTLSRRVAQSLQYIYIDTGAMYRAAGLKAHRQGIDIRNDKKAVEEMLPRLSVTLGYREDGQTVLLDGEDVTGLIRTPEVSIAASDISAIPAVRHKMVELHRQLAASQDIVMDGRDIGTVVLPDAQVKIFLTASVEERARRRYEELKEKGSDVTLDEVTKDIRYRDQNDESREMAPLKPAKDAVIVDTTGFGLEKSQEVLLKIIREKLNM